jgi:hypothetical protein
MAWRPNAPTVVSETIDGEVIVIHLEQGSYFSLRESAAELWTLVENGSAPEAMVETLATRYPQASREEVARETARFLDELRREDLVVDADATTEAGTADLGPADSEFTAPRLEKYTDLQDLIMLDPIHEVEPEGWPAPRQSA